MSTIDSLNATNPHINATVSASAGCGKTWLLVTRIIRLLLEGAEPGSILALTFTRKASAEMSIRLNERLYEMAVAKDDALIKLLKSTGADSSANVCAAARKLYDKCLFSLNPIRIQTFHAFCQDILSRFPLEADIPPGFELIEDTSQIEQQSWEALFSTATQHPNEALAENLDILMEVCNGPPNTRTALSSMLNQRNDWWAYTENQANPTAFASQQLQSQLDVDENTKPAERFISAVTITELTEFSTLLGKHETKTNLVHATSLATIIAETPAERFLFCIQDIFLTKNKQPRARKQSKSQAKSMGDENEQRFLELHQHICSALIDANDLINRCNTLTLNNAWYQSGYHYIKTFQKLKRELRLLDFSDLEWKCYQLLNGSDNAMWIQYKIDQRIDHFLVDEFQDTNPTQWQLLKPLLEEIAANPNERWRSVFLVGDSKQSIYSFRRANPKLQAEATTWLQNNLSAVTVPLDSSRRSSSAIINTVNQIFNNETIQTIFPDFVAHDTHLKKLAGKVTLLPLCAEAELKEDDDSTDDELTLRNPLLEPRVIPQPQARNDEAQLIAKHINSLITTNQQITIDGQDRNIHFGDILILMRNRTHSQVYETVLREHNIPFISNQRGSFLNNLEINDLEKLLDVLITPFNNLAIAQILKSPIFSASDDDLILLAQTDTTKPWYERLAIVATENPAATALIRAAEKLHTWAKLADTIPVHDLLDHIFCDGNLLARYNAAVPDIKKAQVKANLLQFLEMSLELNHGRYPSLSRFLNYLRNFKKQTFTAPDEPKVDSNQQCVRIMTIHASKGLESPVVFLVDSNNTKGGNDAYSTLVYWPASTNKPTHFQLITDKISTDSITLSVIDKKTTAQLQEDLNLLYVATTRARQYLFVSGTETKNKNTYSWYPLIKTAMEQLKTTVTDDAICYSVGHYDTTQKTDQHTNTITSNPINPALNKRIDNIKLKNRLISPSLIKSDYQLEHHGDSEKGQERGTVIHRAIELLLKKVAPNIEDISQQISQERNYTQDNKDLPTWINEAHSIVENPLFKELFKTNESNTCYSELPLLFNNKNQSVYGLVDRLVVKESEILLIDYKSHVCDDESKLQQLADSFNEQMRLYKAGVAEIWPNHLIKTGILFTHSAQLVWIEV